MDMRVDEARWKGHSRTSGIGVDGVKISSQYRSRMASSYPTRERGEVLTEHQNRIRLVESRQVEEIGGYGK
jgi:hypothetical protein